MAEHLHGYPRCETPAGTLCGSSDLHWEECKSHGALRTCEASVVDGIPTGQYRCTHDEAPARPAPARAPARPKGKPRKAAKAKPRAAARKAAPKKKGKAKKSAKRAKPTAKRKPAARRPAKKGARKKK